MQADGDFDLFVDFLKQDSPTNRNIVPTDNQTLIPGQRFGIPLGEGPEDHGFNK